MGEILLSPETATCFFYGHGVDFAVEEEMLPTYKKQRDGDFPEGKKILCFIKQGEAGHPRRPLPLLVQPRLGPGLAADLARDRPPAHGRRPLQEAGTRRHPCALHAVLPGARSGRGGSAAGGGLAAAGAGGGRGRVPEDSPEQHIEGAGQRYCSEVSPARSMHFSKKNVGSAV